MWKNDEKFGETRENENKFVEIKKNNEKFGETRRTRKNIQK